MAKGERNSSTFCANRFNIKKQYIKYPARIRHVLDNGLKQIVLTNGLYEIFPVS